MAGDGEEDGEGRERVGKEEQDVQGYDCLCSCQLNL